MNEKVIKSQKTLTDQFTSYEWFFFIEIAHFLSHLNGVVKNLTKWNNNLALESTRKRKKKILVIISKQEFCNKCTIGRFARGGNKNSMTILEEEIQACQSCDPPEYSFLRSEIPSHSDDSSSLQERARENFEMNNQTKGERNEKVI